jgi:hypothetical protein
MESSVRILKNLKIDLPHHPKSIYTKECKSGYNRATCTLMFIEALFIRAKLWKQHRFLITDGWIKKMCYIYTMEFYSAIKKNEIMLFAKK